MPFYPAITTLNTWANECRLILWNLEDDLDWRSISQFDKFGHGGLGFIVVQNREIIAELIEAMQYFVYGHTSSFGYTTWLNVHAGLYNQEADVSLLSWIEAYIAAHDDHRSAHRLLIDAYQASMYDKPFDKEYHSLWIQRFRSWA